MSFLVQGFSMMACTLSLKSMAQEIIVKMSIEKNTVERNFLMMYTSRIFSFICMFNRQGTGKTRQSSCYLSPFYQYMSLLSWLRLRLKSGNFGPDEAVFLTEATLQPKKCVFWSQTTRHLFYNKKRKVRVSVVVLFFCTSERIP